MARSAGTANSTPPPAMSCPAQNSMDADDNNPWEAATRSSVRVAAYPITAVLSISLRWLWVGTGVGFGVKTFFGAGQTSRAHRLMQSIGFHAADLRHLRHTSALDRKSTRLNSSHRCISYAVFCLK